MVSPACLDFWLAHCLAIILDLGTKERSLVLPKGHKSQPCSGRSLLDRRIGVRPSFAERIPEQSTSQSPIPAAMSQLLSHPP